MAGDRLGEANDRPLGYREIRQAVDAQREAAGFVSKTAISSDQILKDYDVQAKLQRLLDEAWIEGQVLPIRNGLALAHANEGYREIFEYRERTVYKEGIAHSHNDRYPERSSGTYSKVTDRQPTGKFERTDDVQLIRVDVQLPGEDVSQKNWPDPNADFALVLRSGTFDPHRWRGLSPDSRAISGQVLSTDLTWILDKPSREQSIFSEGIDVKLEAFLLNDAMARLNTNQLPLQRIPLWEGLVEPDKVVPAYRPLRSVVIR